MNALAFSSLKADWLVELVLVAGALIGAITGAMKPKVGMPDDVAAGCAGVGVADVGKSGRFPWVGS